MEIVVPIGFLIIILKINNVTFICYVINLWCGSGKTSYLYIHTYTIGYIIKYRYNINRYIHINKIWTKNSQFVNICEYIVLQLYNCLFNPNQWMKNPNEWGWLYPLIYYLYIFLNYASCLSARFDPLSHVSRKPGLISTRSFSNPHFRDAITISFTFFIFLRVSQRFADPLFFIPPIYGA